jgi:hypothetical protein
VPLGEQAGGPFLPLLSIRGSVVFFIDSLVIYFKQFGDFPNIIQGKR